MPAYHQNDPAYGDYVYGAAFSDALTMVACGEERDYARNALIEGYSTLEPDDIADVLADALHEALLSGVEREDIDESWF